MKNLDAEKSRRWRKAHPEKVRELKRNWYHRNIEKAREQMRIRYKKNRVAILKKGQEKRYRLPEGWFDRILHLQGGKCACCETEPATHVDHNHETGAVRAILCGKCNLGLGHFFDDPSKLRKAATYLEKFK